MANISFKNVDLNIIKQIMAYYSNYEVTQHDKNKKNVFQKDGITITIYHTNTVLWQGPNAIRAAERFFPSKEKNEPSQKLAIAYNTPNIIGNDEVGVGDLFGPLVVCATSFTKENAQILTTLPIKDSKKLRDDVILTLAPQIKELVSYSIVIINNETYNTLFNKYHNSHIIKAQGHNQALINLTAKLNQHQAIYIDQFVNPKKYFEYLQDQKNVIKENVNFLTHGEEQILAIACSAILARATFLAEIKKLENKFNIVLPLGASESTKQLGKKYKKMFPLEQYHQFIKDHFNLEPK
ncbi:ribonuclease HIII [Spiroplasma syrphidicola EA-1]|uniref:Ribonuclease n=1 Tax=Spiroplasma syrphidicola EA-1 TaxID=1276229 RepID=R4UJE7_9MOLU|nr:ribonuclease HIII [Spiroplasma syrphidicola]AGM26255.1 ribonuclease HIII [Spiroplasma syrphidicola EA-1]